MANNVNSLVEDMPRFAINIISHLSLVTDCSAVEFVPQGHQEIVFVGVVVGRRA